MPYLRRCPFTLLTLNVCNSFKIFEQQLMLKVICFRQMKTFWIKC